MATLRQIKTGRSVELLPRTLIGRSRRCDLSVPHESVSGEHALIWWVSGGWRIRDLGSRNGTRVDGQELEDAEGVPLASGQQIELGAHPLAWVVEGLGPPLARAEALDDDEVVVEEAGILALLTDEDAIAVIYGDARSGWSLEQGEAVRRVEDQDEVVVEGRTYRLHLPQQLVETADASRAPDRLVAFSIRFRVSSDEEHIRAELIELARRRVIDLGSRAHHYTLLTLARARLADGELDEGERGWIYNDELQAQLQLDRGKLNMLVFRARKQLADAGIEDARDLVERRPDTNQLRLGVARIEILSA